MNKKNLKNKIIEHLEILANDIDNFKGGIIEKLGQLDQTMNDDDEYQKNKEEEVTVLAKTHPDV